MANQADGNLASKGKKGKLTNSQLRLLGFIAACGADGCSETKQALAGNLQISLKTVDRAIHRLREEGLSHVACSFRGRRYAAEQHLHRCRNGWRGRSPRLAE